MKYMRKQIKIVGLALMSLLTLMVTCLAIVYQVQARGSIEVSINRVYNCYLARPESPQSAACKAAIAADGTQQFYESALANTSTPASTTAPTPCTTTPTATATTVPTAVPGPLPSLTVTSGPNTGAPGSHFIITARDFPPNMAIPLFTNGFVLADITTDSNGAFTIVLITTANTASGDYTLATGDPYNAATTITLVSDAPIQLPDAQGESLHLPDGVAPVSSVYLPNVQSNGSSALAAREDVPNAPCTPTPAPTPSNTPTPTAPDRTPVPTNTDTSPGGQTGEKHIVGYYTSWSVNDRDYHVMDIPAAQLTPHQLRLCQYFG